MSTPKINALRQSMQKAHVAALIVPGTDPHCSEYLTNHWKERAYISEFTGSAGSAVITLEGGGLWTDSRYFLQASEQLHGTCINLYREMLPGTPSIMDFLRSNLKNSDILGIDGKMFSIKQVIEMRTALADIDLKIDTSLDPMKEIWAWWSCSLRA